MRNFGLILFSALAIAFSVPVMAQDGPPNPEPGKCYVRCVTPDEWNIGENRVMVKPAHKRLEVIPAEWKTVDERIMIKPATKKFVYVPAQFRTETEVIQVKDPYDALSVIPASFSAGSERVVVRPAYSRFEYQRSVENCDSDDPRDCMVLCYVEHPEEVVTVPTQPIQGAAATRAEKRNGENITITKQVLVREPQVEEVVIPAEYRTITKRVLVKGESSREIDVPAQYRTETVRTLKKAGGITVWEEIECKLTDYNVLPVFYELGSARLTSASRRVIDDKLFALMKAKPNIRIELNSHTDSRGSTSSNQDLSQRRAESVVNYLVSRGISRNRLVAKGYGESRLVNNCADGMQCSEAEHAKNRRTEFRVLSN